MHDNSFFSNSDYGNNHHCIAIAETLAGGKSSITPAMRMALDVITAEPDSILFGEDIDALVKSKLINMFERDSHGLPYLESYVVHSALRQTSESISMLRSIGADGDSCSMKTSEYIDNDVVVMTNRIFLQNPETSDTYKYGRFVPIEFIDADKNFLTRYVEVMDNVKLQFIVNAVTENDRWHMIWRSAESAGLGAARYHGYGKFSIVDWT